MVSAMMLTVFSMSTKAQDIQVGGGLTYGTGIETLGVVAKGIYQFDETWVGSPSIVFFFPKDVLFVTTTFFAINLDANYVFSINDEGTVVYPLAGLNIAVVRVKYDDGALGVPGIGNTSASSSDVGLNIGGGVRHPVGEKLTIFGEAKVIAGGGDQLEISGGVLIPIN